MAVDRPPTGINWLVNCLSSLLIFTASIVVSSLAIAEENPAVKVTSDVPYVTEGHSQQVLDIYSRGGDPMPVVVYVHGGGWAFGDKEDVGDKPAFFLERDIAFVSMNYRLRWDFKVLDQVGDIAAVVRWIKEEGADHGLDGDRIVLMGHAAGAHLVSLVGTNPAYLKAEGLSLSDVRAVVAMDTASYDIVKIMSAASFVEQRRHHLIFGQDERAWMEYSPINHLGGDDKRPAFALMFVNGKEPDHSQAQAFSRVLTGSGVQTILIPGNDKSVKAINDSFGREGDVPTQAVMAFVRAAL